MKLKKLLLIAVAIVVLISQALTMFSRGGHGGGHGGGHAAAHHGGHAGHAGRGGHNAARGNRGARGAGYGYGAGWGGWGNGWGWGFWGGALLWTAPLWWRTGLYAPYAGSGNYVYVIPQEGSDEKVQLAAWSITNNTPQPIQITSGNFSIEVAPGESQDVPQANNATFSVTSHYNNQEKTFSTKDSDVVVNDENGHTVIKNASMNKGNY